MNVRARKLDPLVGVGFAFDVAASGRVQLYWWRGACHYALWGRVVDGAFVADGPVLFRTDSLQRVRRLEPERHREEIADALRMAVAGGTLDGAVARWERERRELVAAAQHDAKVERIRNSAGRLAHALRHLARRAEGEVAFADRWPEYVEACAALEAAGLKP